MVFQFIANHPFADIVIPDKRPYAVELEFNQQMQVNTPVQGLCRGVPEIQFDVCNGFQGICANFRRSGEDLKRGATRG